jgi:hypothetical protein
VPTTVGLARKIDAWGVILVVSVLLQDTFLSTTGIHAFDVAGAIVFSFYLIQALKKILYFVSGNPITLGSP